MCVSMYGRAVNSMLGVLLGRGSVKLSLGSARELVKRRSPAGQNVHIVRYSPIDHR